MKLDRYTINELVELLQPFMEDERSRRSILILALGNDASVLQRITWSGAVATFIPEMVEKLADYGEIAPGKQALWALLECVRSHSGIDSQQRIDKLRPRIDLGWHSDPATDTSDIDALVENVRSRLHDDIQSLHGTMPLWGVDHWVPLGDLFVDVNILEELSSSRRSELQDLWQDFKENPSYRSLDRIGLGKERKRVSGLEVLAKNTNLMVVGKPGSGKTTYLQRVVTECDRGNLQAHQIPVLIKLREFVDDGREFAYSLKGYLEQYWQLSNAETQLVLKQGRALILLDGLDEVTGEDGKKITKEIKRFARTYPQVQVIVTCRTQSQESRFERFDYVEVADFNEAQVRAFAEHWFKAVVRDESAGLAKAQEFLKQLFLKSNKPIRELAITPILLSLTCLVFHQTEKFYSKCSTLYQEGLELLLEQWDKPREIERDKIYRNLSVERKLELLSYVAVKKFEQSQYVLFEQEELEQYIAEFLGIGQRDSRVVLRAIALQHGLLIERSRKVWSFSHLTFQEYLTARFFLDCTNWIKLLDYILIPHWYNIFLLIVDILPNSDIFLTLSKEKIDSLTLSNFKLQKILFWSNQKSIAVEKTCTIAATKFHKKIAIRAFYIKLISNDIFKLTDCLEIAQCITEKMSISKDIAYGLALDFGKTHTLDFSLDLTLCKILDRAMHNNLDIIYYLKTCRSIIFEIQYQIKSEIKKTVKTPHSISQKIKQMEEMEQSLKKFEEVPWSQIIKLPEGVLIENEGVLIEMLNRRLKGFEEVPWSQITKLPEGVLIAMLNRRLKKFEEVPWSQITKLPEGVLIAMLNRTLENLNEGLEKLIQELSNHERRIEGWWNLNGKRWIHKFRKLIILNRNIGYNIYLDDNQKRLVQQYYTGNKLLIDCLKSDCVVSKDVRCKIEQTLLLPITEIEKRKQEQVSVQTSNFERVVKLEEVSQSTTTNLTPETSTTTMPFTKRDQVFISYSHKDKVWLEKLQTMLKPLIRSNKISLWDDTRIKPGAKWKNEITQALAAAKVAVLMVSSNFLASDFIAEKELPPLLNAAEQEGLTIIWVYLSACLYEDSEIGEYQAAHDTAEPLDTLLPGAQNQVLRTIGQAIKAAATEISANP